MSAIHTSPANMLGSVLNRTGHIGRVYETAVSTKIYRARERAEFNKSVRLHFQPVRFHSSQ